MQGVALRPVLAPFVMPFLWAVVVGTFESWVVGLGALSSGYDQSCSLGGHVDGFVEA